MRQIHWSITNLQQSSAASLRSFAQAEALARWAWPSEFAKVSPRAMVVGEKTQCQDNLVQVRRIVVQHGLCPWAEETLRRL